MFAFPKKQFIFFTPIEEEIVITDPNDGNKVRQEIQAAINQTPLNGVVKLPAGEFDIEGVIDSPDGIHITGTGRDSTILRRRDRIETGAFLSPIFRVDCRTGQPFKFSNIELHGIGRYLLGDDGRGPVVDHGLVIEGHAVDFEIYDCRFTKFSRAAIELIGVRGTVKGSQRGVIHSNEFIDNYYRGLGYGVAIVGDAVWSDLELGTENAVFVEDNYFQQHRHNITCINSGKYVLRYNIIRDSYDDASSIDAHGYHPKRWTNGTRSVEIYNNDSRNPNVGKRYKGINIRGGDGVIYNNRIDDVNIPFAVMCEGCPINENDQTKDLWVWGNIHNNGPITESNTTFADQVVPGRDVHFGVKPEYISYTYPHPARTK